MRPLGLKIYQFQWEMSSTFAKGMSFRSFFKFFLNFCSIIALECAYKFAKGCAQWLLRYINFNGKCDGHVQINTDISKLFTFSVDIDE